MLEILPASVLLDTPEPDEVAEAPPAPVIPVENKELSAIELASIENLMGHGARLMDSDRTLDILARGHQSAQQANEFQVSDVLEQLRKQIRAGGSASIWLRGNVDLGRYDLESETFAMDGSKSLSVPRQSGSVNIAVEMIGPDPFGPLAVPADLARAIVESGNRRQIEYYIELLPEAATPQQGWPERATMKLLARPRQVIFFQNQSRNLEEAQILGRRSLSEANAEDRARLDRTFETSDFDGLSDRTLQVDAHVMDLLALAQGAEPEDSALDAMMLAAWRDGRGGPGPAFFDAGEDRPDAPQRVLYRPSFRSWMQAKADALGDTFTVRIVQRPQDWCRDMTPVSQIPQGRAITSALPDLRERTNNLARSLSQAEGAIRVDQRYVQILQRPSLRSTGCEQWGGFIRLRDSVHEHNRTPGYANGVQVAFTVENVTAMPNQGQSMDILVDGQATKTWILTGEGDVGPELEPFVPKAEPEAVAVVRPAPVTPAVTDNAQAVISEEAMARARADVAAEVAAIEEQSVDWLDASGLDVAPSDRDVVGLHLGDTMQAAHSTVIALPGIVAAFETTKPSESSKTGFLAYQRIYVRRDGSETIILAGPEPEGPVLAIVRRLVETERALPLEGIKASVIEKYGAPDSDLAEEWGVSIWADAPAEGCIAMADDAITGDNLREIDAGSLATGRTLRDVLSVGWTMAPPNLAAGAATGAADCGEVLAFGLETPLEWGHSGFNLTLIDMKALATLENAGNAEKAGMEIDF